MPKTVCSAVAAAKIPVSEWWSLLPFNNIFITQINAVQLKSESWLTSSWEYTHSPRISKYHSLNFPEF